MVLQAQHKTTPAGLEIRTRFGSLPVNKDNILTFPHGLPGFENLSQFVLFHDASNHSVFYLQSAEDPSVRLPLTSPHWFQVDYQISLTDEESDLLQAQDQQDLVVLVTVSETEKDSPDVHANFNGPIIINLNKRIAIQKTLHEVHSALTIRAH